MRRPVGVTRLLGLRPGQINTGAQYAIFTNTVFDQIALPGAIFKPAPIGLGAIAQIRRAEFDRTDISKWLVCGIKGGRRLGLPGA